MDKSDRALVEAIVEALYAGFALGVESQMTHILDRKVLRENSWKLADEMMDEFRRRLDERERSEE